MSRIGRRPVAVPAGVTVTIDGSTTTRADITGSFRSAANSYQSGTASYALIADDPDAPAGTWVHWVLYNLPADATSLAEAVTALPAGTREGVNDWKRTGYGGPCPPIGRHRYFHKLYALDKELRDLGKPTKAQLLAVMEGHILGEAQLVGTYQRPR